MDDTFATPRIVGETRPDGTILLRSTEPLRPHPSDLAAPLLHFAGRTPDAVLAAERDGPRGWRTLTYAEALARAESAAEALLARGLGHDRPLVVLSGNTLNHLVLTLAGYLAGIPLVPVSPGYSASPHGRARLRTIVDLVRPGAVYAEDGAGFDAALAEVRPHTPLVVTAHNGGGDEAVEALFDTATGVRLARARAGVGADTVAKILFTSGSTGVPKAVPNTHGMLCAVQQMMRQAWPFLERTPLVTLDWLPWSHTFGGNHNLNMVLAGGGTLHIDDGGPDPDGFARSRNNLADVSPTVYFNVPAGFEALATALEADEEFATRFFSRMRLLLNAGAPLQESVRRRVLAVAARTADHRVRFTSSWGLTETSSAVTSAHFDVDAADAIGVPLPGISLKLAPVDGRFEMRVSGPTVMPRRIDSAERDPAAFDEEGYYRTGDAGRLLDPADLGRGLAFDGRLAEDFKLTTGTWVRVGALRSALLGAVNALSDVVITGPGRGFVGALAWAHASVCGEAELRHRIANALAAYNTGKGSSLRVERLLLLSSPPSSHAGELSAKGTVNQRLVLERRRQSVDLLYGDPPPAEVIVPTREPVHR